MNTELLTAEARHAMPFKERMQADFDYVLNALRKQGVRSARNFPYETYDGGIANNVLCVYRNGVHKCAFGHLIPDPLYSSSMDEDEGMPAREVLDRYPDVAEYLLGGLDGSAERAVMSDFYMSMQRAHDQAMPTTPGGDRSVWEERMRMVANDHSLVYTPPQEN